MPIQNILPIAVGQSSTNADLATKLGEIYEVSNSDGSGPDIYRLVKNNSAGTLSKNQVLVTGFLLGVPTYKVTTTTTAANPAVCGVVPVDFGSNTIADQAYFLLQISGSSTPNMANTSVSNTAAVVSLGTGTTAGYCQHVVTTVTAQGYDSAAAFGIATNSAGVTAAGQPGTALLQGLI